MNLKDYLANRTPDTDNLKKVTFRGHRNGKAHRGFLRANGRLVAACSCPGSNRGDLVLGASVVANGWHEATCKH